MRPDARRPSIILRRQRGDVEGLRLAECRHLITGQLAEGRGVAAGIDQRALSAAKTTASARRSGWRARALRAGPAGAGATGSLCTASGRTALSLRGRARSASVGTATALGRGSRRTGRAARTSSPPATATAGSRGRSGASSGRRIRAQVPHDAMDAGLTRERGRARSAQSAHLFAGVVRDGDHQFRIGGHRLVDAVGQRRADRRIAGDPGRLGRLSLAGLRVRKRRVARRVELADSASVCGVISRSAL